MNADVLFLFCFHAPFRRSIFTFRAKCSYFYLKKTRKSSNGKLDAFPLPCTLPIKPYSATSYFLILCEFLTLYLKIISSLHWGPETFFKTILSFKDSQLPISFAMLLCISALNLLEQLEKILLLFKSYFDWFIIHNYFN